jgi:hypothetical protein
MKQYTHEDVTNLFKLVVDNVEQDLVHHIKHNKTDYEAYVFQLRNLDRLKAGFSHQLEEALNGN